MSFFDLIFASPRALELVRLSSKYVSEGVSTRIRRRGYVGRRLGSQVRPSSVCPSSVGFPSSYVTRVRTSPKSVRGRVGRSVQRSVGRSVDCRVGLSVVVRVGSGWSVRSRVKSVAGRPGRSESVGRLDQVGRRSVQGRASRSVGRIKSVKVGRSDKPVEGRSEVGLRSDKSV